MGLSVILLLIVTIIQALVHYTIFNEILTHFGIDGLSFFQFLITFTFIREFLPVGGLYNDAIKESFEGKLSDKQKAVIYFKKSVKIVISTVIFVLIYTCFVKVKLGL